MRSRVALVAGLASLACTEPRLVELRVTGNCDVGSVVEQTSREGAPDEFVRTDVLLPWSQEVA